MIPLQLPQEPAARRTMPTEREQQADAVVRCIDAGDVPRGLQLCQQLNRGHPDYAYGWYLASYLLKRARRVRDALVTIDRALALGPSPLYRLHRARCLLEAGDASAALAAATPLLDASFTEAHLHNDLGALLNQLGRHEHALEHYTRATALDDARGEYHFNRAALLRYLGDIEAADAAFDAAIARAPGEYEAYNARAQLRTQTPARNHVAELEALIPRTTAAPGRVQLHFALAKELEDLGEHARAFASLQSGAALKRRHLQYRVETDLEIMEAIREVFGPARFEAPVSGCDSAEPIFVIGMPRTGTTLVERILGSHSQVCSAGELNTFAIELTRLTRAASAAPPATRGEFVQQTARVDFRALGHAYLEGTRAVRGPQPLFIDKLPFNFLYAGLIHLALPRARIVSLSRHPVDTCYAVYKQLFRDAYPFSYDLDELARYYIGYAELMAHWNRVLPGVIHTVRYEDLVTSLDTEVRRLLDYCRLPFEEECLRFHENPAASTTASATQVRQPIYRSSLAKWRHYAQQLEPLRARLRAAGIEAD